MTPDPATVAAMAAERMIVPCVDQPRASGVYDVAADAWGVYAIDPDTAAEVADRLVAEAVAAERQRILDALHPLFWVVDDVTWRRVRAAVEVTP